jgi:hypothetical protein
LCSQLAVVWSLIEGAPLSGQRGDAPPTVPDAAIAGIRQTMDLMTAPYLRRRRKKLYCDKSLGAAVYAELLVRIYPGARFICLFRHAMDMISSGLEACPWGLNGYGFDRYIADSPGNAVMALARYWLDGATAIAKVEEQHPHRCHRVRYEDMVADPEAVAAGIFDFLGVEKFPGVGDEIFSREHERFGPADHKIWYTSAISQRSVGRSDALPVKLIPPHILESINGLLDKLGYVQVDESWGTADMPASLLASAGDEHDEQSADEGLAHGAALPETEALAARLTEGLGRLDPDQWKARMAETFTVVIRQPNGALRVWWHVDLRTRAFVHDVEQTVTGTDRPDADGLDDEGAEADWSIVGTAEAWSRVLHGDLNISVALRRNELRYCDYGEGDFFISDARISLLAGMLGMRILNDTVAFPRGQVPAEADWR